MSIEKKDKQDEELIEPKTPEEEIEEKPEDVDEDDKDLEPVDEDLEEGDTVE